MRIYKYRILIDSTISNLNSAVGDLMEPIDNSLLQWQPQGRVRFENGFWIQRMILVDVRSL